jgi:hypothetical protein
MVPRMRGVHSGDQPACYFAALGAPQVQIAQREEGHVIYRRWFLLWNNSVKARRQTYREQMRPMERRIPRLGVVWNRAHLPSRSGIVKSAVAVPSGLMAYAWRAA